LLFCNSLYVLNICKILHFIIKEEYLQYFKDFLKQSFYKRFTGIGKRSKTSMQRVLLELKLKQLLPEKIIALEMFGMHGLWHTMDYIDFVISLDMFEINKTYHEMSKGSLKNYPVKFHHQDSIKYISETKATYNFVVADAPIILGKFFESNGLPYFFNDLIKVTASSGIIIFNFHSNYLHNFLEFKLLIQNNVGSRKIKELFFVPRNENLTYGVLVLE